MEKEESTEQRDPSASEEIEDLNNGPSSHDQRNSWSKSFKLSWSSANVESHFQVLQHALLIWSNNNNKNGLDKEKEQPQTVKEEVEVEQYFETLEDKEDSKCTTGNIPIVSDPLYCIIDLPEVELKKIVVNKSEKITISSLEAEPKADIVMKGKKSTSCHPEGTSVRDSCVISNGRESSSIQKSRQCNVPQEPRDDKGRGSFLTIASQFRYKLNYIFTLLFCSLFLIAGSAAQPVWDGMCHWSELGNREDLLWNYTESKYFEDCNACADERDHWIFLGVEGVLFLLGAIVMCLFWKFCMRVWHGAPSGVAVDVPHIPRIPTNQLARDNSNEGNDDFFQFYFDPPFHGAPTGVAEDVPHTLTNQLARDDSDESDDDCFQSCFDPAYPVPATTPQVYDHPLPDSSKKSASSQNHMPKRRNLSQSFFALPLLETGVNESTSENPESEKEITFGLPLDSSELSTETTLESSPSPEETAAYDQLPALCEIQELMDEHSPSAIVSGKWIRDKDSSALNTMPAANVCATPLSSHTVTMATSVEFGVSTELSLKTFGSVVEDDVAMEPVMFTDINIPDSQPHTAKCFYQPSIDKSPVTHFISVVGE